MIGFILDRIIQKVYDAHVSYPDAHHFTLDTRSVVGLILSSLHNVILQPTFLCIFTPQAILALVMLPFFIYGIIIYRNKYTIMIMVFIVMGIAISINNSLTEALIRHRLCIEMIYYSIAIKSLSKLLS